MLNPRLKVNSQGDTARVLERSRIRFTRRVHGSLAAGLGAVLLGATLLPLPALAAESAGQAAPSSPSFSSILPTIVDPDDDAFVDLDDDTFTDSTNDAGADADGDTLSLPVGFAFDISGGSAYTVSFDIPRGLVPTTFHGSLQGTPTTELRVKTPTRAVTVIDTSESSFEFSLKPGDVDAQGKLSLTFALPPGTWCTVDGREGGANYVVTVSDGALEVTGEAALPSTVADFFGPGALEATVDIPVGTEAILGEAALNMVAGANAALGNSAPVALTVEGKKPAAVEDPGISASSSAPAFARRTVVLENGSDPVTTTITRGKGGIPTLTLNGSPDGLISAARAFGQLGIVLASAAETEGLSDHEESSDAISPTSLHNTLSVEQLGSPSVSLSGYGRQDAFIAVTQGAFNRPLESMTMNIVGATSVTDMTVGTVQFLWNDTLVDSFVLDPNEPQFDRTFTISGSNLHSGNYLVMRLQAVSANNKCIDESLLPPVRVDVDTQDSTVKATNASSIITPSFQRFPQVFANKVELAFGLEPTATQLSAAGQLIAALQRATPVPLSVTMVPVETLLSSRNPGILIGATSEQAQRLNAPVYFTDPRLINARDTEVVVGVDQPYAALQAVQHNNRSLLVLGANRGEDGGDTTEVIMTAVSSLPGVSWWQLEGDLRLATEGNNPILINTVATEDTSASGFSPEQWGIGTALLILALIIATGVGIDLYRRQPRTTEKERDGEEIVVENLFDARSEE